MLHIKKEKPKITLPKLEVGSVFQLWLFQPRSVLDFLDGGWFGHQTSLFQFLTQLPQSKTPKDICKTRLLAGEKSVATALEIFFSKLVLSTVSHIFVATKLQS